MNDDFGNIFIKPIAPNIIDLADLVIDETTADHQYDILMSSISDFEKNLDDNHEIAFKLTHVGQTIILHVTSLGYSNPSLIHFYGFVDGSRAELIQHISQINFLMIAVEKQEPSKPPNRIGFKSRSEED